MLERPEQLSRPRTQRSFRSWLKGVGRSDAAQRVIGNGLAAYLRLVHATSRVIYTPARPEDIVGDQLPVIITMWHGQHFMLPLIRPPNTPVRALISRHRDGEINAIAAHRLGVQTIRGSGGRERQNTLKKGGIRGFLEMKSSLDAGISVCLTADISNGIAKRAGLGVVALAKASGRPILPIAFASNRRIELRSWDRAAVNLPFSRAACVTGNLIFVAPDADAAALEAKRLETEQSLNAATEGAYRLVDRRHG
ncbi:MAG: lysophospholipid acyltransferase family protein [Bauldia sp.]